MKPYTRCDSVCLVLRVCLLDVLLPLARKGIEITTIIYFWYVEYNLWGLLTTAAILLPGLLEICYWSATSIYSSKKKGCCYWSVLFNPLFYPFTMMAWNVSTVTTSILVYKEKYPTTRVLTMIQTLGESCPMMLIQTYILLQTWRSNEMNIFQGLSIFISLLTISKEFAEHHFHELSAKSDIPSFGQVSTSLWFYFATILLRLPSYAILSVFLQHWFFAFLLIFASINFFIALKLKTDVSKNVWTAIGSLIGPICFISKGRVHGLSHAGKSFYKLYCWNAIVFFTLTIFSHIILNFFLVYGNDYVGKWLLNNIRLVNFLGDSCYTTGSVCPGVHIASMVAVFAALIQGLLIWAQNVFFPHMIGEHFPKTSPIYHL